MGYLNQQFNVLRLLVGNSMEMIVQPVQIHKLIHTFMGTAKISNQNKRKDLLPKSLNVKNPDQKYVYSYIQRHVPSPHHHASIVAAWYKPLVAVMHVLIIKIRLTIRVLAKATRI